MNSSRKDMSALIEFLRSRPQGASARECSHILMCGADRAGDLMRRDKRFANLGNRGGSRWCLTALVSSVQAHIAEQAAAKAVEKRKRNNAHKRLARKLQIPPDPKPRIDDWVPERIFRNAKDAPPLPILGPRSVFDLGAACAD